MTTTPPDYTSLRADCEFRMRVLEGSYTAREVIPVGDWLYDPQLRWAEDDGSIILSDIGGQPERGFDPNGGYGAIYRLRTDDTLEEVVPRGMHGLVAPLRPLLAPQGFGPWGGQIFTVAQQISGRHGAHNAHRVYRIDPSDGVPLPFVDFPHVGTIGDGVPGAGMNHTFGPAGTPHEGYLYCSSLLNCVLYRVGPDATIEPFLISGPPLLDRPAMPFLSFVAPDFGPWKPIAGELLLATRSTTYLDDGDTDTALDFWVVSPDGKHLDPFRPTSWRPGVIAPSSFGEFAGHMFTVDEGSTNLLHASIDELNSQPLPYDARIVRIDPDGGEHTFCDGIQGGSTTLAFSGNRLMVASSRKSYSTGEYHEPDGSIYEVACV